MTKSARDSHDKTHVGKIYKFFLRSIVRHDIEQRKSYYCHISQFLPQNSHLKHLTLTHIHRHVIIKLVSFWYAKIIFPYICWRSWGQGYHKKRYMIAYSCSILVDRFWLMTFRNTMVNPSWRLPCLWWTTYVWPDSRFQTENRHQYFMHTSYYEYSLY